VIYTDFKKAFDKVFQNRLISYLGSYGIDQALVNSPYGRGNLFSRLHHMGSKMTQIQALFFPNNFRATKKLKAHASSTKTQQLRALKFLFYTALQITFLFSLLARCIHTVITSSVLDSRHFLPTNNFWTRGRVKVACHFPSHSRAQPIWRR